MLNFTLNLLPVVVLYWSTLKHIMNNKTLTINCQMKIATYATNSWTSAVGQTVPPSFTTGGVLEYLGTMKGSQEKNSIHVDVYQLGYRSGTSIQKTNVCLYGCIICSPPPPHTESPSSFIKKKKKNPGDVACHFQYSIVLPFYWLTVQCFPSLHHFNTCSSIT